MIYTLLVKKDMRIAACAHAGQFDKVGYLYIHHPLHQAEGMTDEVTTCAAILYDVMEDTSVTCDELRAEGIPEDVLTALLLLTHDERVPYLEYVAALKDNAIARAVKLADLKHNSDLSRLDAVDGKALARVGMYRKAKELLLSEV